MLMGGLARHKVDQVGSTVQRCAFLQVTRIISRATTKSREQRGAEAERERRWKTAHVAQTAVVDRQRTQFPA